MVVPGDTVTVSGLVWPTEATPLAPSRGDAVVGSCPPFKVSNVVCGGGEGLVKGFWARAARWVTPSDVAAV